MRTQRLSGQSRSVRGGKSGGGADKVVINVKPRVVNTSLPPSLTQTPQRRSLGESSLRESIQATPQSLTGSQLDVDSGELYGDVRKGTSDRLTRNLGDNASNVTSSQRSELNATQKSSYISNVKSKSLSRERSAGERKRATTLSSLPTRNLLSSLQQHHLDHNSRENSYNSSSSNNNNNNVITSVATGSTLSPAKKSNVVGQKRKPPSLTPAAGTSISTSTSLHIKRPIIANTRNTSSTVSSSQSHAKTKGLVQLSTEDEITSNVMPLANLHTSQHDLKKQEEEEEEEEEYYKQDCKDTHKASITAINDHINVEKDKGNAAKEVNDNLKQTTTTTSNSGNTMARLTHNMAVRSGGHPGALKLHHSSNAGGGDSNNSNNNNSTHNELTGNVLTSSEQEQLSSKEYKQHIKENVHQSIAYLLENTSKAALYSPSLTHTQQVNSTPAKNTTQASGNTPSSTSTAHSKANKLMWSGTRDTSVSEPYNLYNYDALTTASANNVSNVPSIHHTYAPKRGVGESFNANEYFSQILVHDKFVAVEVVPQTATLWAAQKNNDINIYSALTEKLIATIPGVYNTFALNVFYRANKSSSGAATATVTSTIMDNVYSRNNNANMTGISQSALQLHTAFESQAHYQKQQQQQQQQQQEIVSSTLQNSRFVLNKSPSKALAPPPPSSSLLKSLSTSTSSSSPSLLLQKQFNVTGVITAMYASAKSRMWIGYSDGTIRIMNHILLEHITQGTFHHSPIVSFVLLNNGMVVAGSVDGMLSQWTDYNNNSNNNSNNNNNSCELQCITSFTPHGFSGQDDGELECLCAFRSHATEEVHTTYNSLIRSRQYKNEIIDLSSHSDNTWNTSAITGASNFRSSTTRGSGCARGVCGNTGLVFCGFRSGMVCCVDMGLEKIIARFAAHTNRINAMASFDGYLFTAAEDHLVFVWNAQEIDQVKCASKVFREVEFEPSSKYKQGQLHTEQHVKCFSQRDVLKIINVQPSVRALVVEECTRSVWVAYANGLIERWSASLLDDFVVEETIRANEVVRISEEGVDSDSDDDDDNDSTKAHSTVQFNDNNTNNNRMYKRHKHSHHNLLNGLLKLTALGVARTLQILALSSSGHNKVWYSHFNTLNVNLERAVEQLNSAITRETEIIAAWREKTSQLTHKERTRQRKYVEILESLNQKRLMWIAYEHWRRHVMGSSLSQRKADVVQRMAIAFTHNFRLRYFSTWLHWLYKCQWKVQRVQFAHAMSHVAAQRLRCRMFNRWLHVIAYTRMVCKRQECVNALASAAATRLRIPYYLHWRLFAENKRTHTHKTVEEEEERWEPQEELEYEEKEQQQEKKCIAPQQQEQQEQRKELKYANENVTKSCSPIRENNKMTLRNITNVSTQKIEHYHIALLEAKAQRQIMQRLLRQWRQNINAHKNNLHKHSQQKEDQLPERESKEYVNSYPYRFATLCSRWNQRRHARVSFSKWLEWTRKHRKLGSLAVVMAMRGQQVHYQLQQLYYLKWVEFVHLCALTRHTNAIHTIEVELNEMQSAHEDIFDKLQLQKKLTEMEQIRAKKEETLAYAKRRVEQLERTYALLQSKSHKEYGYNSIVDSSDNNTNNNNKENLYTSATAAASVANAPREPSRSSTESANSNNNSNWTMKGEMSTHDSWYRELIEHQHLSPVVLQHLSFSEALQHVIAQLKGNILNMYTDMQLFRTVKDKRTAGISAAAIFNEAFAQIKRIAVAPLESSTLSKNYISNSNNKNNDNKITLTNFSNSSQANHVSTSVNYNQPLSSYRWPLSFIALDNLPSHHCTSLLNAIKTLLVAFDLLAIDEVQGVRSTCEEIIGNADWLLLCARAAYMHRRPVLPANNRGMRNSM